MSSKAYAARLARAFAEHPPRTGHTVENFIDAQRVWDETMAARAVAQLNPIPTARMLIVAGVGHVAYENGIAGRISRRSNIDPLIVFSQPPTVAPTVRAEHVELEMLDVSLPPQGRLGVFLDDKWGGPGVGISGVVEDGPANGAGVTAADAIISVQGASVSDYVGLKLSLMGRVAGTVVSVRLHSRAGGQEPERVLKIELY
jgi:hypothetical protein